MKLYFAPLASSMATRIMLDEVQLPAEFIEVCPLTHRTMHDGGDYRAVHPFGTTPALRTDDGALITENVAVLSHIAEVSGRLPEGGLERARLLQWLSFVATEVHKGVFTPFFDRTANEAVRSHALVLAARRLNYLDATLEGRTYVVGDDFSVVDAYLVTLLHSAQATPVDLTLYPNVAGYLKEHLARPSVANAIALELPLFLEEQKRAQAMDQRAS